MFSLGSSFMSLSNSSGSSFFSSHDPLLGLSKRSSHPSLHSRICMLVVVLGASSNTGLQSLQHKSCKGNCILWSAIAGGIVME